MIATVLQQEKIMPQDKIESRRAFMKKFGKLAGAATVALPFITMTSNETVAKPKEESPATGCEKSCTFTCTSTCKETLLGGCGRCQNACTEACARSCNSMCGGDCGGACVASCIGS